MLRNIRDKLGTLPAPGEDAEAALTADTSKAETTTTMTEFQHIGEGQAYAQLLDALSNGTQDGRTSSDSSYFQWYLRYLQYRVKGISTVLLRLISPELEAQQSSTTRIHPKALLFMVAIAQLLKSEHDLALDEILEKLEQKQLLQPQVGLRSQAIQLIFIAVGLLTFFYDPVLDPKAGALQILCPKKPGARLSRNDTWIHCSQDMSHTNQPIVVLVRRFGGVKGPIPRAVFKELESTSTLRYTLDALISPNVSYFTLTRVAQIKIEWVSSICLHLEFDMRCKVLKLFRFPSLCGVLCTRVEDTTFLSQFFDDYFADEAHAEGTIPAPSAQFYREVIQSYRILFGQDRHSWRAFVTDYGRKGPFPQADTGEDDLLPWLCGNQWLKQPIYEDIDVSGVKTVYSARTDFPFFADRLLSLQDFAVMQCPSDWRTVWRDRRDIARFWTLWAVMVFGGASIVIGIIQVALAVAQVAAAYLPAPKDPAL